MCDVMAKKFDPMDEEDAIDYLERKDEIVGKKIYTKEEKIKIKKVMKEGKIYGDPMVELSD